MWVQVEGNEDAIRIGTCKNLHDVYAKERSVFPGTTSLVARINDWLSHQPLHERPLVQNAFSDCDDNVREFIISGMCGFCFDERYGTDEEEPWDL